MELFLLGGWLFWSVLSLGLLIALIACAEHDRPFTATAVLVLTAVAAQFFTEFKPFTIMAEQPLTIIYFAIGYLSLGVAWGYVKWISFVKSLARKAIEARDTYLKDRNWHINNLTDDQKAKVRSHIKYETRVDGAPQIRDNKSRVITWMAYWPVSMLWTLLDDPVRRAFNYLYNQIAASLQKISDRAFSGVNLD